PSAPPLPSDAPTPELMAEPGSAPASTSALAPVAPPSPTGVAEATARSPSPLGEHASAQAMTTAAAAPCKRADHRCIEKRPYIMSGALQPGAGSTPSAARFSGS